MKRKLSKIDFAVIFFASLLVVSICGLIVMQSLYRPSYIISATKLNEKPAEYFVLDNPDRYVLEAMTSQSYVVIASPDDTQIDELISAHGNGNLEYNSSYYQAGFLIGDNTPPYGLPILILTGIAISIIAIVLLIFFKTAMHIKNRKQKAN
jgi:hypothetical protein